MTSFGSFFFLFLFLSATLVAFTPDAGVSLDSLKSLLSLCCFFFLFFLALLEGSGLVEVDVEVEAGPLPPDLSPQFIAP